MPTPPHRDSQSRLEEWTLPNAAEFSDIAVLAIPLGACASLPPAAFEGKVTLDLLNYFPQRDGHIPQLATEELTTSQWVASHLRGARLVKAFNSITADDLLRDAQPAGSAFRRALPIAGDDPAAKQLAARFIEDVGFDVVDSGGLAESWRFERFRPAYCVALDGQALTATLDSTARSTRVPDGYWLQHRQVPRSTDDFRGAHE